MTAARPVAGPLFHDLFAERAAEVIITTPERRLTGRDVLDRAARLAGVLRAEGLQKGECAVAYLHRNEDAIVFFMAAWWLLATPVILDFRSRPAQRQAHRELLSPAIVLDARKQKDGEQISSLVWDEDWFSRPAIDEPFPVPEAFRGLAATISLSSGTTGASRGYVHSHERFARRMIDADEYASAGALLLTPMTMSFSATRNVVLRTLFGNGHAAFMPPLFSASELAEEILRQKPASVALPPPIITALAREAGERSKPLFPFMRMLRSIGGPATVDEKINAYTRLTNGYCMSYASGLTGPAARLEGPSVLQKPHSVGVATPFSQIEIVDPQTLELLPTGETGAIRIRSPYVADKVLGVSGASSAFELFGNDWGMPGDLGHLDDEGFLTIVGRQADMIVRGGVNVSPSAVENALKSDPRIRDAGVVGIDAEAIGQEIAAFVEAPGMSEAELHALCMELFSYDKRPRILRIVRALPYNANGKLDRKSLPGLL